jgi:alcohol dehydrogenase class IV
MVDFEYTSYAREVIFGPGSIESLGHAVDHFRLRRLLLCTSPFLRRSGHLPRVERALGPRLVVIYDRIQPHVPAAQLAEVVPIAAENEVDAVIGLGGGSTIGMAKAVSLALEERRTGRPARAAFPTDQPIVPVVAVPTTYAGSEMTPVYGVTQDDGGTTRKMTVHDAKIAPKLIIYDPVLTLDLPPALTASTGINALAHCIEALYSMTRNPLSSAAALAGVRDITRALPRCYAAGADLEARTQMLTGAFLAGTALAGVSMALHHGLCHILGGTAGVPHGIANSIVLPHVMRFNLDATAPQLAVAAEAMGVAVAGLSAVAAAGIAVERVDALIGEMRLPRRLRDAGVPEESLPGLAAIAMRSRAVLSNPKPITDAAQLESLLRAAW